MGLVGQIIQPVFVGIESVLMSPLAFIQRPSRWLSAISRYSATHSGGPNFAYELCIRRVSEEQKAAFDLSSWEVAFNGAEPVSSDTLKRFAADFACCGFRADALYPCYGLAESTLLSAAPRQGRGLMLFEADAERLQHGVAAAAGLMSNSRTLVGCGRSWLDGDLSIVDPDGGRRCAPGEIGEIWVRGSNVASAYWNHPEASARAFGARVPDTGEWPYLRTGDLGFLRDGELFVTGRIKDLLIIAGRNHYPQDIEHTVEASHVAIRPGSCAAFGVSMEGEERLVIAVEVEPSRASKGQTPGDDDSAGKARLAEELEGVVRRAVAREHELHVAAIALVKAGGVPKTSSGKLRRQSCREAFEQDRLSLWSGQAEGLARPSGAPGSTLGKATP
jgi:acyl-CoA synthetase (AMP-forming)/AMP-acid ligase II